MRILPVILAGGLALVAGAQDSVPAGAWEAIGLPAWREETAGTPPAAAAVSVVQVEAGRESEHTGQVRGVLDTLLTGDRDVSVLDSADFFSRVLLRSDRGFSGEPLRLPGEVQNHSWVANRQAGAPEALASSILRAFDFQIQRDGVVAVASLRNDPADGPPDLLSHSYNAVIVGLSNGRHSAGLTRFDDPGRGKPDLVAPADHTSFAVPMVAGAAGLLLETAATRAEWRAARRPEAVKAILLAGASRAGLADWEQTPLHPLDDRHGAGQLSLLNSHHILTAGTPAPGDLRDTGWTVLDLAPGGTALVPVHVEKGVCAALCWLREVRDTDPGEGFSPDVILPNHDLRLGDAAGRMVAESRSERDNVELIRHTAPAPGEHVLVIQSDLGGRVALAWRGE